ncbi:MAG: 3-dehydroquinate synthase, partial [Oscillospiraceae bacterium]
IPTASPYQVTIGSGLLPSLGDRMTELPNLRTVAVVTDDRVGALYGETVCRSLERAGFAVCQFVFAHGEGSKRLSTLSDLLEFLAAHRVTRSDALVALGGGVVGDLAGFAAAVYLRGIRFVQLPTTLLAAVDASVGGKTGIDLDAGKNLAGAFWQPAMVLCDPDTFVTLPDDRFSDGVAEALKTGIIADAALFSAVAQGRARERSEEIIARCVEIKRDLVAADERDLGVRQLLNLGHTVAHAVERCSGYTLAHGQAVAIGLAAIARAADAAQLTDEPVTPAILGALRRCGLPERSPFGLHDVAQAAQQDKKCRGGRLTLVIPKRIGGSVLYPIEAAALEHFLAPAFAEDCG